MPSHNHTLSWSRNGESFSKTVVVTADTEHNSDPDLTASQTNLHVIVALTAAAIKSIYITCDTAIVIKTNSSGSPADTLTLAAGQPLQWYYGCGMVCPITADVTSLYITNSDATASTAHLRFLVDGTP